MNAQAVWRCGHARTPENTKLVSPTRGRCLQCHRKASRESMRRHRSGEAYRKRYLPIQLAATREKLRLLENEARRYGMTELLVQSHP